MNEHHAVLILGESLASTGYLSLAGREETEMEILRFETLSIVDVRKIIQSAYATSLSANSKTIVIETRSVAVEAQQALLKIFEEPPETTKFILVLPSQEGLLPTLLSRVSKPGGLTVALKTTNPLFTMFQSSSYSARMECIARITKDKDTGQIELLQAGVLWLLESNQLPKEASQLAYCVMTMNLRGSSKKMLLEEIALILPVVSPGR